MKSKDKISAFRKFSLEAYENDDDLFLIVNGSFVTGAPYPTNESSNTVQRNLHSLTDDLVDDAEPFQGLHLKNVTVTTGSTAFPLDHLFVYFDSIDAFSLMDKES
ncbi:hypothetical protein CD120_11225 [Staphylococcus saprophyticus]|uniref:hypothetical protein n=1 Tax=Staphylococcus saprophyticus TaxID=29385 RepID=UPI000CD1BFD6|nr:hypothetical protein [Staphylococcus saprophyticus]PNZ67693.1 hypothetical protein CD120_11225 [Staphylococcus saprophyticus]